MTSVIFVFVFIFQAHSLKMNSSFHAFQLAGMPDLSPNRKHIRLKKSMSLSDDTLEYWGFYLLKGSTVVLSVCSRYVSCQLISSLFQNKCRIQIKISLIKVIQSNPAVNVIPKNT
jgi:hypothetical protein